MSLTLYIHPLASFCHKVLIALYENGTPFRAEIVDLASAESSAPLLDHWPIGKIPVLVDERAGRSIPETSIIIEYLQQHYPGPQPLLPVDEDQRLQARLWDRFFDLYVSSPVQKIVTDTLRPQGEADAHGVADAHATLDTAYAMIERRMAAGPWAMGDEFTIADCAAAPALFFSSVVHPVSSEQPLLAAYVERLITRPSVKRVIAEARPYFWMFPYRHAMPERYLTGEA